MMYTCILLEHQQVETPDQELEVYTIITTNYHSKVIRCWFITLGAHAQRGYGSCVCVCVYLSVTLYLTSRMFVRLTNDTTYLTGNGRSEISNGFL